MHRIASTLTLGLALSLAGCAGDDGTASSGPDDSSTSAADGSTTDNTTPGTTSNGSVDSTAGSTTDPETTVDPDTTDPGTTTEPGTTTDMEGSTTDPTGGMVCDPDPADDMCASCVKMNCCSQLEACVADGDATMGCSCFQDCVANGGSPIGECDMMCMVNPLGPGTPTGALASCTLGMCAAECPL